MWEPYPRKLITAYCSHSCLGYQVAVKCFLAKSVTLLDMTLKSYKLTSNRLDIPERPDQGNAEAKGSKDMEG